MNNILITGGTGTLGNQIVDTILSTPHQLAQFNKIIIFSRDEQKQEIMFRKFRGMDSNNQLRYFVGDIRDKNRLKFALREVDFVIHAAAMKIVPAVEYNPSEAVRTNIDGTQNLVDVCLRNSLIKRVVAVSTDKAVKPVNLYGATKLVMEKLVLAANVVKGAWGPNFSIVRYGNVSGSRGSVIPLFREQLADKSNKSKEVTITDQAMTRFCITADEAANFVLFALKRTSLKGSLYVPKMPAYGVTDLAYAMGAKKIKTIGIRQGEKIHEDIITEQEIQEYGFNAAVMPMSSNKAEMMSIRQIKAMLKKAGV